jgi:hypothetical protein
MRPVILMRKVCVSGTQKWDEREMQIFKVNKGRDQQEYEKQ